MVCYLLNEVDSVVEIGEDQSLEGLEFLRLCWRFAGSGSEKQ